MRKRHYRILMAGVLAVAIGACAVPANISGLPGGVLVGGIRPTSNTVVLAIGEEKDLVSILRAADGSLPTQPMIWASSNDAVATVTANSGRVRANAKGTAIITASLQSDPTTKISLEVTVVEKHTVSLIKVEPSSPWIAIGDKIKLAAQVQMADGQINGNVTWSSSDDTIAAVNPTTGEVSALREGRVTILAAFALDPKYKGLSEITIVKDRQQIPPSASPSPIIFKPDSTPLPGTPTPTPTSTATAKPTPTPTATSTTSSGSVSEGDASQTEPTETTGTTNGSVTTYSPPTFAAVRQLAYGAKVFFIDFDNVIVAEGTTLLITNNAGASWTKYENVGSQSIRCQYWTSATEGWVAGDNGTILKVAINNGNLSFEIKDSGTSRSITSIYFTDSNTGFLRYYNYNYSIKRTSDGGNTWGDEVRLGDSGSSYLGSDGHSSVVLYNNSGSSYEYDSIYRYNSGGFVPITGITDDDKFNGYSVGGGIACIKAYRGSWYKTSDWTSFTAIPMDLKTPTQIIRNVDILDLNPINESTFIAVLANAKMTISRDGGKTWLDPKETGSITLDWVTPFSEAKMWGWDNQTLYRAGL